jgi:hypothetical protein
LVGTCFRGNNFATILNLRPTLFEVIMEVRHKKYDFRILFKPRTIFLSQIFDQGIFDENVS